MNIKKTGEEYDYKTKTRTTYYEVFFDTPKHRTEIINNYEFYMEAKDKAQILVNTYYYQTNSNNPNRSVSYSQAKYFALIAVDELIQLQESYNHGNPFPSNYYQEVKQEIEKL